MAGAAFGILAMGIVEASAGGFAIREESSYFQGMSFAGAAAGGALSSMFWNPATMTQHAGINVEGDVTAIFPYAANTPAVGSTLLVFGGTGDTGDNALVPAAYASWQVSSNIWLGVSFNAPFGLSVSFPDLWAGRNYAQNTSLKTYDATPTIAVRLNDWISFGAGVQIMYGRADLNTGLLPAPGSGVNINGDGWGYGFTAGVTLTPGPNTQIGIGWRSFVDLKIDGTMGMAPLLPFSTPGGVSTTLKLPDTVTASIRQRVTDRFSVMGTVEWSDWSRIGTSAVNTAAGGAALIGGTAVRLPFQYSDGWFFSVGGEYMISPQTTVRAGVGYEISPIVDSVRTPRLPDNDRFWLSAGLSYKIFSTLTVDLAYSHLFVRDTNVNISAASGNPWFNGAISYIGHVDASIDIFSVGVRYQFAPPPPPPLIRKG